MKREESEIRARLRQWRDEGRMVLTRQHGAEATAREAEMSDRVIALAERIGVPVRIGRPVGAGWFLGPSLATWIRWPEREVVVDPWRYRYCDLTKMLSHEIAHCLDAAAPPEADEVRGLMLAAEYAIDRAAGVKRTESMAEFCVYSGRLWRECSARERGRLLAASRVHAVAAGVVHADGRLDVDGARRRVERLRER